MTDKKKKPRPIEEITKGAEEFLKEKGEKEITKEDFEKVVKAVSKKKK